MSETPEQSAPLLRLERVRVEFGRLVAVHDVSFEFKLLSPEKPENEAEFAKLWPFKLMPVLVDGERVTGLVYRDRGDDTEHTVELAGIFVQIGLLPNTEWLADTVELTNRGEVVIDHRGATSVPGVFAAGDCATTAYKQIVIAMGSGATAGLSAFDHLIRTSVPELAAV